MIANTRVEVALGDMTSMADLRQVMNHLVADFTKTIPDHAKMEVKMSPADYWTGEEPAKLDLPTHVPTALVFTWDVEV